MDALRAACAEVAARARSVRLRPEMIAAYAASLRDLLPATTPAPAWAERREPVAAFWLTLDAINFGSGWFPELRKRPGRSGYNTIAAGWRERHDTSGPFTAAALTQLDGAAVARILGQDPEHELMALYAASLRDLGSHVAAEHRGSFAAVSYSAGTASAILARTF